MSEAAESIQAVSRHEGLATFVVLFLGFFALHFYVPVYLENAGVGRDDDVEGVAADLDVEMLAIDEPRVSITEDVFESARAPVKKQTDLRRLESGGRKGDIEAQVALAKHYGLVGDENRAFTWCMRAAFQGHGYSMLSTGDRYYYGRGTRPNVVKAVAWYRLSAQYGEAHGEKLAETTSLRLTSREAGQVETQIKMLGKRIAENVPPSARFAGQSSAGVEELAASGSPR